MSLPKTSRVVRSSEFRHIYQTGRRITSRFFVAFCACAEAPEQATRLGFTVPRAVGKAVARNRIRRRMREACRTALDELPLGWRIVFNPRRNVLDAPFSDLCREITKAFARCAQS